MGAPFRKLSFPISEISRKRIRGDDRAYKDEHCNHEPITVQKMVHNERHDDPWFAVRQSESRQYGGPRTANSGTAVVDAGSLDGRQPG